MSRWLKRKNLWTFAWPLRFQLDKCVFLLWWSTRVSSSRLFLLCNNCWSPGMKLVERSLAVATLWTDEHSSISKRAANGDRARAFIDAPTGGCCGCFRWRFRHFAEKISTSWGPMKRSNGKDDFALICYDCAEYVWWENMKQHDINDIIYIYYSMSRLDTHIIPYHWLSLLIIYVT